MSQLQVEIRQNGEQYEVVPKKGKTLLEAAIIQEVPLDFKCQKGNCKRCVIELLSGKELLNSPTEKEYEKIPEDLDGGFRLACQVTPI
ncbi:2Fe-2S iron-sulfur cluster-binding protein [Bacillus solimangrovi]|uniref:2Fe-2S ferredoxin-type domain-containing protein n=1 Tax=Bacillus solimangrovi TaxID=1305675 RepID=A0A1E5LJ03_9BACI|nr:2Fe-2S iron-sulfur cluster-binding protein [Bacillus solimangrovi]OEH94073.1 hypothetical protein BFG57_09500 [Bacillus solimangrovi]